MRFASNRTEVPTRSPSSADTRPTPPARSQRRSGAAARTPTETPTSSTTRAGPSAAGKAIRRGATTATRRRGERLPSRNAIDHVGEGVTIDTGLTETGFYVADDGPGIPESDRDRIFDHGYTTGDDGTGLGLSIVAQLAEAHGWTVSLDPTHDGARFVVGDCETEAKSDVSSQPT